jgi:hypothetical protein
VHYSMQLRCMEPGGGQVACAGEAVASLPCERQHEPSWTSSHARAASSSPPTQPPSKQQKQERTGQQHQRRQQILPHPHAVAASSPSSRRCTPRLQNRQLPFLLILLLALLLPGSSWSVSATFLGAMRSLDLSASAPRPTPLQLVNCINEAHDPDASTTWASAMADVPGSLQAVGAWWSNKPQRLPLTIVTQASPSL